MTKDEYNYIRKRFLQDSYDTPEYPASIARVMMDSKIVLIFLKEQNQSFDSNIKLYIRWLRKLRDKRMFIGNKHDSRPSKFVSIYKLNREMKMRRLMEIINAK